jgi:hypothetical protein
MEMIIFVEVALPSCARYLNEISRQRARESQLRKAGKTYDHRVANLITKQRGVKVQPRHAPTQCCKGRDC